MMGRSPLAGASSIIIMTFDSLLKTSLPVLYIISCPGCASGILSLLDLFPDLLHLINFLIAFRYFHCTS